MRPLRRGLKSNIFDNMLAMTEKYASNLEALVDERTQLLIEEKQVWTPLLQFFEFALTKRTLFGSSPCSNSSGCLQLKGFGVASPSNVPGHC